MGQKIFRTGNSLAVVVPAHFVHDLGLKPGDKVKVVTRSEEGIVTYKFSGLLQLPLNPQFLKRRKKRKK